MSRLPLMGNLARVIRSAHYCKANRISSREGLERVAAIEARAAEWRSSRRKFLAGISRSESWARRGIDSEKGQTV